MMSLVDNEIAVMAQAMVANNKNLITKLKEDTKLKKEDKDSYVFTETNMKEAERLAQETLDKNLLNAILKDDTHSINAIIVTYREQNLSDNLEKLRLEAQTQLKNQLLNAIIFDDMNLVTQTSKILKNQGFNDEIVKTQIEATKKLDSNIVDGITQNKKPEEINKILAIYKSQGLQEPNLDNLKKEAVKQLENSFNEGRSGSDQKLKDVFCDAIVADDKTLVPELEELFKNKNLTNEAVEVKKQAKILLDLSIVRAIRDNKPSEEINKIVEIYDKHKLQKPNIQDLKEKVAKKLDGLLKNEILSGDKEKVSEYLKIYDGQKLPKDNLRWVLQESENEANKVQNNQQILECIVVLKNSLNTNITINQPSNPNITINTKAPTNSDKLKTVGSKKWQPQFNKQNVNLVSSKLQRTQSEAQIGSKVGQGISFVNKFAPQGDKSDKSVVRSTSLTNVKKLEVGEMHSEGFTFDSEILKLDDKSFLQSDMKKTKPAILKLMEGKKQGPALDILFTAILSGKINIVESIISYAPKNVFSPENCIKVYNAAAKVLEKMLNGGQKELAKKGLETLQVKAKLNKDNLYKPNNILSKN